MDLRCRKTNCEYNKDLTCTAPKINITNKLVCKSYKKGKEDKIKDFSSKNNYDDILEKSINYSSLNNRLDLLIKRVKFASPEKLENILKYIQECLK